MDYLQFTTLRNSAKEYFDEVEKGKSFVVIRKGKPIARVIPFEQTPGWKRDIKPVTLKKGTDSFKYIREERIGR
ncbi:MAG: type II toxin-antitoxin system Phd/YefM family antitoxin [Cytophagales bacterium]